MKLFIFIAALLLALVSAAHSLESLDDVIHFQAHSDTEVSTASGEYLGNELFTSLEVMVSLVSSTFVLATLSILYQPICHSMPELMFYIFALLSVIVTPSVLSGLIRLKTQFLGETSNDPTARRNDIFSGMLAGLAAAGLRYLLAQEYRQRDGEHLCAQKDTNTVLLYNHQFTFMLLIPVILQFLFLPRQPVTSDDKDK